MMPDGASLEFENFGPRRFKHAQFLQERTAREMSVPCDNILRSSRDTVRKACLVHISYIISALYDQRKKR